MWGRSFFAEIELHPLHLNSYNPGLRKDALTRRLREPLPQAPDSTETQIAYVATLQFFATPTTASIT